MRHDDQIDDEVDDEQKLRNGLLFIGLLWLFLLGGTILVVSIVEEPARATGFGAIFAGVSAILAAFIAYKGAIAKAELDRRIDRRNERRIKLNLALAADQALASLEEQCTGEALDSFIDIGDATALRYISKKRYRLELPPRLESVLTNLGNFKDPKIITIFGKLNSALRIRKLVEEEIGRRETVKKSETDIGKHIPVDLMKELITVNRSIFNEARVLRGLIEKDIPREDVSRTDRIRYVLRTHRQFEID